MKKLLSMFCALCALCCVSCSDDDEEDEFSPNFRGVFTEKTLEATYVVSAIDGKPVSDCEFALVTRTEWMDCMYVKNLPLQFEGPLTYLLDVIEYAAKTPVYDDKGYRTDWVIRNGVVKCRHMNYNGGFYFDFNRYDRDGVVVYEDVYGNKYTLTCKRLPLTDRYKVLKEKHCFED